MDCGFRNDLPARWHGRGCMQYWYVRTPLTAAQDMTANQYGLL